MNRILLSPKQNTVFDMGGSWVSAKLKELYSSKKVTKLLFNAVDGENAVEKLYVNGRDTKVEANESRGHAVLGKSFFWRNLYSGKCKSNFICQKAENYLSHKKGWQSEKGCLQKEGRKISLHLEEGKNCGAYFQI